MLAIGVTASTSAAQANLARSAYVRARDVGTVAAACGKPDPATACLDDAVGRVVHFAARPLNSEAVARTRAEIDAVLNALKLDAMRVTAAEAGFTLASTSFTGTSRTAFAIADDLAAARRRSSRSPRFATSPLRRGRAPGGCC